jgi:1-aminocyclopropane-1-carboxylate deaminase
MQLINSDNITVDKLMLSFLKETKVSLFVLRLDKIHPLISGNKWFKLRYYIEETVLKQKTILTFGGAWSNHIVATAAACKLNGLNSIGIIRGEEPATYSATLKEAINLGMQLHFISRQMYAAKEIPSFIDKGAVYIIPEGGYGEKGVYGATTILNEIDSSQYTHFCCAAGTGTMAAGIAKAINKEQKLLAFSVLKGHYSLLDNIIELSKTNNNNNITLEESFHFGGYAKKNTELLQFMNMFYQQTSIPTDFVYTAKLFYGIMELIKEEYFPPYSKILAIHSGGLQGNQSVENGSLIF